MAQFEQWFDQDFKKDIKIRHCESVMFTGDNEGAVIGVHLFDGGTPYSGGGSIIGYAKRIDGGKVALTGSLSGNAASVVIPQAALAYPGPLGIHVVLTSGDQMATVLKAIYSVDDTTGIPVDPGQIVPDWEEFLAELQAMRDGTAAANAATQSANSAASSANSAASSANSAASSANAAAVKINDMTVDGHNVLPGAGGSATLSLINGHYHIAFGLEKGEKGDDGVVGNIGNDQFAFSIDSNGHLILYYNSPTPPDFSINSSGHLIYTF
jgi:hypothetical protein